MPFLYTPTARDWLRFAPQLAVGAAALLVLLLDLVLPARRRALLALLALIGIIASAGAVTYLAATGDNGPAFFGMVTSDQTALFADVVILLACGLALLFSPGYCDRQGIAQQGEYYALLLLATAGMMLMAAATNLMTIFVGLELLSLPLYILSAYIFNRFSSQEAGMKYFLLSSFASGFLLYGMALTYGATGATSLAGVRTFLDAHAFHVATGFGPLLLAGLGLMAVGFCFKVSGVPFHAWTPDVYVGAPTTITGFMSVGTKVAAFVALARTFSFALYPLRGEWEPIFWAVAVLSMVVGNLLAVTQTDVKRMLAYSSVAHAGYMLVGIAIGTLLGFSAVLIYLAAYAVMNLGAFGVVLVLEGHEGQGTLLADYAGLGRRRPALALALAICLFALAGIPPSSGFIGKWAIFYAAIVGGHLELAIIGLGASVLGIFYYLRVIWAMYFTAPAEAPAPVYTPTETPPVPALAAAQSAAVSSGPVLGASLRSVTGTVSAAPATSPARATATAGARSGRAASAGSSALTAAMAGLALLIATGLTLLLGILPGPLFQFATQAAGALFR